MNNYTPEQIDIMLNLHFRDQLRPAPYKDIIKAMKVPLTATALDRLLWGVITGYGGNEEDGPRKAYEPTVNRLHRGGWLWRERDTLALKAALGGAGQLRRPPCDVAYIAAVLARPVPEVAARWAKIHEDVLGRKGFFG